MLPSRRILSLSAGMAAAVALTAGAIIASVTASAAAQTAEAPAAEAPGFTAVTASGGTVSLSDFRGQPVILEWTNADCPFVRKHYASPPRNMQTLQERAAEEGMVWLSVISSAPGKQGHVEGPEALQIAAEHNAAPTHIVLDPEGEVGRLYEAKTTPHMFVIDAQGGLVFQGGIDDTPSTDPSDIDGATNYVALAMDALADEGAGRPAITSAKPYGCSVKY